MTFLFRSLASCLLLSCSTAAWAQAPAAPVPPDPSATTAAFGDWVLRCQKFEQASLPPKLCEVSLSIQLQGQTGTFAQVAIAALPKEPFKLTIALPPNISLPGSVKASVGEKAIAGLDLGWRRCLPAACIADAAFKDEILKLWRAGETAQVTFTDGSGRDLKVSFKLRGLAQALDALAKS